MSNPNVFTQDVTFNKRVFVTQNLNVTAGDSVMSGHMIIAKDLTTNVGGRTFLNGNVIAYRNLTVSGTLLAANLAVSGTITGVYPNNSIPKNAIIGLNTFDGNVTVGGNLSANNIATPVITATNATVEGNLSANNIATPVITATNATVEGNLSANSIATPVITATKVEASNLIVQNDATINSRTFVNRQAKFTKNVIIDGSLSVLGDVLMNYLPNTIPSNAIINGNIFNNDLNANRRLFVTNNAEFSNNIIMKADASFNGSIKVGGNVNIANRLSVKDISISGNLDANFANSSIPSSAIAGGVLSANTFANDVSMSKRLFVTGDITAKDNLFVVNDASFNQKLNVIGAAMFGNTLAVTGAATFANNLTILGSLDANFASASIPSSAIEGGLLPANTLSNDVSMSKRLFVTDDITAKDNLFVIKDASFNQKLNVVGAATLAGTLAVTGAATFTNNVTVNGNLTAQFANASIPSSAIAGGVLPANALLNDVTISKRLFVTDNIIAKDELHVVNDASFNRTLRAVGAVTLGSTLAVTGAATFVNNVTILGNLDANFASASIPSSAIEGGLLPANTLLNDVTLSKRLFVIDNIIARDELHVVNDASFNRTLMAVGAVTLGSTLAVSGAATFSNNLTVNGNLTAQFANASIPSSAINGGVLPANTFTNDVTLSKRLIVIDDITANDNLFVMRDASFNQKLNVVSMVTMGNTLAVAGAATFANNLTVNGNLTAQFASASIPSSAIAGGVLPINTFANDILLSKRLFVTDDITANDNLFVMRDASFNQKLNVVGAVTMGNTLAVAGAATFANNLTVNGNLTAQFASASIPSSAIAGGVLPTNTFANDISLSKRLFVTDDITANDNLFVMRDASFNQKLNVVGAVTLGNTLNVTGISTFINDVSVNKRLFVTDDIIARDNLNVTNDASFNRTMKVGAAVTLGSTLAVTGAATFANNVTILGSLDARFADASIPSSAILGGIMPINRFATDVSLNQRLFVTGNIIARDELHVINDASFNKTLRVGGPVTLGSILAVTGAATFANNLTVNGNLTANFTSGSIPATAISGGIMPINRFTTDVSLNQRLFVTGDIIARDELHVTNDASFNQKLRVGAAVTLGSTLAVTGATTFANNVTILGSLDANFANASIPSSAIEGGVLPANTLVNDVSFPKRIFVVGDASFGKIIVGNDATFNKNIIANGDIRVQDRLIASGLALLNDISANKLNIINDSNFNGNVYINKDLTVRGRLNVQEYTNSSILNTTTVNYATIVTEDLSVNGNLRIENASTLNTLTVTNDAIFNKILATGDIRTQQRLYVIGDASIGGILTAKFNDGAIPSSKIAGGVLPANALSNNVSIGGKLFIGDDISINGMLNAKYDSVFDNRVTIGGNIQGKQGLYVIGDASIGGILTAKFNDGAIPSSKIAGGALPANTLINDVTFGKRIFVNADTSFNGKLNVVYDSEFNQKLTVSGNIQAKQNLFVTGDASIGGILTANFNDGAIPSSKIAGGALPANTLSNDVTFTKKMFIGDDVSINGNLYAKYDSIFDNRLTVGGNIQGKQGLYVIGDASIGGILTANFNDGTIPSSKIAGGALPINTLTNDVTFTKKMFIGNDISINGNLYAKYDSIFDNRLTVGGNIQANQNLAVTGNTTVTGNVNISGNITANYPRNSIPQSAIIGLLSGNQSASNLIFDSDISMQQKLFVGSDISTNGVLYVSGTGTSVIKNNLTVNGIFSATTFVPNSIPVSAITGLDAFIGNNIGGSVPNFSQDVSMNKRLFVSSDISSGGTLVVTGATTLASTLLVNQATTLGNALMVAGDTTLAGALAVTGKAILRSDVSMNANVDISGNVGLMNNLIVKGNITMNGGSLITTDSGETVTIFDNASAIYLGGATTNTTIGKTLSVNNATTLGSTLAVTGKAILKSDVSMNANVDIGGNVGLMNNLIVKGNITMNGGSLITTDSGETVTIFDNASAINLGGVTTNTTIGNTLSVNNATTLGSTLAVTGKAILRSDVSMNANVDINGNVGLMNNLIVKGNITMNGGSLITTDSGETVTIFDNASAINLGGATTNTTIGNTLLVNNATTLGSTLAVTGKAILRSDVSMNANVDISGNVGLMNNLIVKGNITMNGGSLITTDSGETVIIFDNASAINLGGVTTNTTIGNTLSVNNATTIGSTLAVTGKAILRSDVSMNANVDISGNVNIGKALVVTGEMNLIGDMSLNRRLFVARDISVNGISIGRGNGNIATNTGFGINTLQSVTGANNTGFGSNSLPLLTGGTQNAAFGTNALSNLTTANKNTAVGYNALSGTNSNDATTNTAIGANAGSNNSLGSSLTFLGADTQVSNSTINYQNSTAIGAGAVITDSNQMVLGAPGQNLNIVLNANRMSGVRANIIDVSLINFTAESIPASAIVGSSGTSTALTGAVFIENTLSVSKLATFKENISILGAASIGSGLALNGDLLMADSATIGGNLTVPSINNMLTFVTYSDVAIASGLSSSNINLATTWAQQAPSSNLPLGNWLGGLISETGQYQYMYDKLNPTKIYRSVTYGTIFEQKSLVASIYDNVNNLNNINNVLAMDYTGKYVAIGGNQTVSYSSNYGLTFNEISNTIVNSNSSKISAIAISGTGKFMFIGGTNSQLFVSTDSGTLVAIDSSPIFDQQYNNWKSISTNGSGLWTMAITSSKIFITNPGGSDTLYNAIWLNKTASKHANMVLANVTDSFISNDGGVFGITTTTGVYISKDHGTTWVEYATANGYNSVTYTYTRSPLLDGVYIYATTANSGKLKKSINSLVSISIVDGDGTGMPSTTYSSVIVSGNGGYTYLFDGTNISYRPYLQINTGGATVKVPSGTAFVLDKDAEIKQKLIVTNDVSFNNRLFVTSDVSLNQKLYVANDVSMNGNVGILNNLKVTGNITMNGGSLNTTDSTETVTIFDTASIINLGGTSTNINIGTGTGTSTTVTIGANNDTVNILGNLNITGTTTTISAVNLDISDNAITLNKGGPSATFAGAGINIEDGGVFDAGYIRVDADRARFVVKLPSLASGSPQYIATKDGSNDLSANNFTTNGNITMAGSGNIIMTGKYIKQF